MSRRVLGMSLLIALLSVTLRAEPTIRQVSVRGLRIGGATTIVVEGAELSGEATLLGAPITKQVLKPGGSDARLEFEVTIDPQAEVGIYQLRAATKRGVSNPVTVSLDTLPQRPFGEKIESLPVALTGKLEGDQILKTTFAGQRGQRVVVEIESRRLGAKLRPVLRLLDPTGRQIAWSPAQISIHGDARCQADLPSDGVYTVQLHDLLYRGEAPGIFRLKIGELNYGDLAFPLGLTKGQVGELRLLSTSLPAETLVKSTPAWLGQRPLTLPATPGLSGSRPRVFVSEHAEVVETDTRPQPAPAAPVALNGRISKPAEEDQFELPVTPGARLRFSVMARQVGSKLDGVLMLRGEKGNELARNDDRPGSPDPRLDFTVPANVNKLIVALRDLQGRGGEQFVYRVAVEDLARPDFQLTVERDRLNVPEGGRRVVRLRASRSNYGGPIHLRVDGLAEGVEVEGDKIPAGADIGLLTFNVPKGVSGFGLIRFSGASEDDKIVRVARGNVTPGTRFQPWLRDDVAVAVAPRTPISIRWAEANDRDKLFLGAKFPARVELDRLPGAKGKVRLRLLTTQTRLRKKIKKDNKQVEVDDVDRMLRLSGAVTLGEDVKQSTLDVLVPADLPPRDWGLVLVAELLSADGKQVLATTTTASRFFPIESPISLRISGDAQVEAKAGGGDTGAVTGEILRAPGWSQPVTVTLTSLPKDYPPPKVVVPADKSKFSLPIRFPYGTKAGELKGVRVEASYLADPKKPQQQVRSNAVEVMIRVTPGEKPPAEAPLTIFEDDAKFLELLGEGGGKISLEPNDKHFGAASAKVTPDQRFNGKVPTLGVKIREKPGPGEYRFLRFAWKKKGGQSICLQINHDDHWGPGGKGREGAKFRYHSGPGSECFGASLKLDEKIPEQFVVVTRDLFADFGEFTFSGIAFSPMDGEYGLFDHLYLGRSAADFELIKPATKNGKPKTE